jgi:hypothetical protein
MVNVEPHAEHVFLGFTILAGGGRAGPLGRGGLARLGRRGGLSKLRGNHFGLRANQPRNSQDRKIYYFNNLGIDFGIPGIPGWFLTGARRQFLGRDPAPYTRVEHIHARPIHASIYKNLLSTHIKSESLFS